MTTAKGDTVVKLKKIDISHDLVVPYDVTVTVPEQATDWFIDTDDEYNVETLYYVKDGLLYNDTHNRIDHDGDEIKKGEV